jgi:chromosome partitioning protein
MYITVASYKGGVGKTTTAVHLAAYMQRFGKTLLIDGDPNRSATTWAEAGKLPFTVVDVSEGMYKARMFDHVVIDTEARPDATAMKDLAKGCDFLVIPAEPGTLNNAALALTVRAVHQLAPDKYKVLVTKVPPPPQADGMKLRADLAENGIPMFAIDIPRLKVFEKAAGEGVPVYDVHEPLAQRAWEAYEAAGKEIWLMFPLRASGSRVST